MNETIDLLQIRIEKAKAALPAETQAAINAVNWRDVVLGMKTKKGYSLEQLEDLELETELLLCGLASPDNYPKELETKMKIPMAKVDELVNEMNELVFKKIREELVKTMERTKVFENKPEEIKKDKEILKGVGIEITTPSPLLNKEGEVTESRNDMLAKIEKPEIINKLSASFQMPIVKTEYTLGSLSKQNTPVLKADPYRLSTEE